MISVIIPVYNVAPYLKRCIESVLRQQNSEYEIILVDDGSTDESPIICDDYAARYDTIKTIHKVNEGLGFARNTGLDACKGDYVFFLDSDDYIPDGTLEYLTGVSGKTGADIISFPIAVERKGVVYGLEGEEREPQMLRKAEIIEAYAKGEIATTACSKLYKRFIFDNERFSNVRIHEDAWSMHLFLNRASTCVITYRPCYVQYVRQGSIMQSKFTERNFLSLECGSRFVKFIDSSFPAYHQYAVESMMDREKDILHRLIRKRLTGKFKTQYREIRANLKKELAEIDKSKVGNAETVSECEKLIYHPVKSFIYLTLQGIKYEITQN